MIHRACGAPTPSSRAPSRTPRNSRRHSGELVADIGSAGGLVYVHHGICGRNVRACLVLNITQAGPYRLLNIRVDQRKKGRDLMIAIGHELRHVLEVLNEPSAVDADSIRIFYERIAPTER